MSQMCTDKQKWFEILFELFNKHTLALHEVVLLTLIVFVHAERL